MKDFLNKNYLLEQVKDTAILQLYAEEFEQLKRENRILAYYLSQAALAGRDIYYDQNHRYALEIRETFEETLIHSKGINSKIINNITDYTKLFWVNNCHYNERTKQKFIPNFSFEEFQFAVKKACENGAKIPPFWSNQTTDEMLKLKKVIFDPQYEPLITSKNPTKGFDIITGSANNFYSGVTLKDLENFKESYPRNSRLTKINGELIEQVYRMGDEKNHVPPGLYVKEISNIVKNLQKAIPFASQKQQRTLSTLIKYFKIDDENVFDLYNRAWLADNPEVDAILGFIEVYKDARGQKGAFEGIVYYIDHGMTKLMQKLAQNAQYFENNAPWNDEYKKKHVTVPSAHAISVIFGTGDGGPFVPLGINLPNSQALREKYGSKSLMLTNVLHSINLATGEKIVDEFVFNEAKEIVRKNQSVAENIHVAIHEILGHGSGKVNPELKKEPAVYLKEYYSTLEEARADLTALYHIFDPKLIEMDLIQDKNVAYAEYWRYATTDLTNLRRVKTNTIEDDHMRATHLIISYLQEEIKAIEPITEDGKIYFKINSYEEMYSGVKILLSELMRIKAEGDYDAAKNLINRYGVKFNSSWRDQIIQRAKAIGLPDYFAFVMPTLVPIKNDKGELIDVKVTYGEDFKTQMLKYSGKLI
jgi:dipeptidyl-peptidase-3